MKIVLSLTHRCNLACRYCYAGKAFSADMSSQVAEQAVDFGFERALALQSGPQRDPIDFQFFGGEPLLAFPLLEHTTRTIQRRAAESGLATRFTVTTNGTLLRQSHVEFFNAGGFNVCISIDGPRRVHDLNRVYPNGRGSFDEVCRRLRSTAHALERLQVNAVYTPQTLDTLPEALELFLDLGVRAVHFNPDIEARWSASDYPDIRSAFLKIARLYCDCYEAGLEVGINFIDSMVILYLKGGYGPTDLCGMASTQWAIAPSGNIYPCERFIGEDDGTSPFILGHVSDGLNVPTCAAIRAHVGNRNRECAACPVRRYCMNWCGCTNYHLSGMTDLTGPGLCAIQKAAMQAAEVVVDRLATCSAFVNHFYEYLSAEESEFRIRDTNRT